MKGSVSLVLHAHLPWVRHPEHPVFLEEDWLYEAITETYLPLVRMMDRLAADEVPFQLALTVSPPLLEMFGDTFLGDRYARRLDALVEVAERAARRLAGGPFGSAAGFYVEELREVRRIWRERPLAERLREHRDAGRLCVVTVAGTHGFLPLMATDVARRAQIESACRTHERWLGRRPLGIWLPECAYAPGLDSLLAASDLRFTFAETHALTFARPRPRFGHARPIVTSEGVAFFARDPECSTQVWSADLGYPGDPAYREFYRDLGWDGPDEVVAPLLEGQTRRGIGLKLHRVTGRVSLDEKAPWSPEAALRRAAEHARHFLDARRAQVTALRDRMDLEPHLTAPFDAELFGHWWFEGPAFLEALFRAAAADPDVGFVHPEAFLATEPPLQVAEPAASSWGDRGTYEVWLNGGNAWIYRHLHHAEETMTTLVTRLLAPEAPSPLVHRVLAQMGRELLLAQASDWAFILTMKTVVPYAIKRTREHLARFLRLAAMLEPDPAEIDEAVLAELETRTPAFPDLDPGLWHPAGIRERGAGGAVWTSTAGT